ncbi:MAG: NAD(P)H-dependent oxidoreductase subunit E [Peptococcaceae bacterium]|nr:NAD(P)H-dependent oxidoreductase subunit E [Peptococcaceae bacterium]
MSGLSGLSIEGRQSVLRRYSDCPREHLLDILLDLQRAGSGGHIDEETAIWVAEELDIAVAKVYEALSFYTMLHTREQARFVFEVCGSTPCFVNKSQEVGEILSRQLGVGEEQMTSDGLFAYRFVPCFGACAEGPAIRLGDELYGNLTEKRIRELIMACRDRLGEADKP